MATYKKIPGLDAIGALADGDLLEVVDVSDTSQSADGSSKKLTALQIAAYLSQRRSGHVRYSAPVAASANAGACALITNIDVANGAQIIAAQPDFPRKLLLYITDANSSISAGTLDLVGIDASGNAATESILLTGGTASKTSTKAYASITSATVTGLVGAAAGDKIALGVATALALVGNKTPAASAYAVFKADVDSANETVGTVDATAGTIVPTTVPNGTHAYDFWFNFTV